MDFSTLSAFLDSIRGGSNERFNNKSGKAFNIQFRPTSIRSWIHKAATIPSTPWLSITFPRISQKAFSIPKSHQFLPKPSSSSIELISFSPYLQLDDFTTFSASTPKYPHITIMTPDPPFHPFFLSRLHKHFSLKSPLQIVTVIYESSRPIPWCEWKRREKNRNLQFQWNEINLKRFISFMCSLARINLMKHWVKISSSCVFSPLRPKEKKKTSRNFSPVLSNTQLPRSYLNSYYGP